MTPFQSIQISPNYLIAHQLLDYYEYEALLEKIKNSSFSLKEFNKIKNEQRRFEWLSIRHLMIQLGFEKQDIIYDEHGKPSLLNSNNYISISHSKNRIAVGINKWNEIGIDLQKISSSIDSIKHKFLSSTELNKFKNLSELELTKAWSTKEAIFKANGKKDIYLKDNIEIIGIENRGENTLINALFKDDSQTKPYKVNAIVLKDYVLAYTLND
jgi:phosphopantetheinyl transferase